MTRDQMIAAADFVHSSFGPDADPDIEDDGSAFITTPHATLEGLFAFDHQSVSRLTLVPELQPTPPATGVSGGCASCRPS